MKNKIHTPNDGGTIKAITIWQPWASLIVHGFKKVETRGWATRHRGNLFIHAAKKPIKETERIYQVNRKSIEQRLNKELETLPYGSIIGKVNVADCVEITPDFVRTLAAGELDCGDYTYGRYAWI